MEDLCDTKQTQPGSAATPLLSRNRGTQYEVVYTWPDGTEEVRYRRPIHDLSMAYEVLGLRRAARMSEFESPYSVRRVS